MKTPFSYVTLMLLLIGGTAYAQATDHPSIRQSIGTLQQTKAALENGEHGFGGHRAKAIEHIDSAIKELQTALEYAELHPGEVKAPAKP